MQYEYRIDDKNEIIYQSIKGECSTHDLETAVRKLTSDSAFSPHYAILTDLQECEFDFRSKGMEEFFQKFKDKFSDGEGKSALLVASPIETAIAVIHSKNVEGTRNIKVFSTYEAAMSWLKRVP